MKPSDLCPRFELGQYWVDKYSLRLHRVVGLTSTMVSFDHGWKMILPLRNQFALLWYTSNMSRDLFEGVEPNPKQAWVCISSEEVFFIHPEQPEQPGGEYIRVLASGTNICSRSILLQDLPKVMTQEEI